jgi:hypothetical protein
VTSEKNDEYTTYTSGNFSTYAKAREHQKKISDLGIAGAFVRAFINGKKVDVGEAIKLTDKK